MRIRDHFSALGGVMVQTRLIDVDGLQALVDGLRARGFTVIGPTVRGGAIVNAPLGSVDDLPRGWGDEQAPASYRLRPRDDDAFFGFAAGAQSAKPVFFPADELLWRGRRTADGRGFEVDADGDTHEDAAGAGQEKGGPYALLGVRSCDLSALGIHDTVLAGRHVGDAHYARRRGDAFVVAVACSDPGGTCFCVSMGTGPRPESGRGAPFDLCLTELLDGGHRFVVEVGSERGGELLDAIGASPATVRDVEAATHVTETASRRMGRRLDTDGLKELLYASVDSPRWDDVASRCLSCTNCTMVCPTCFCTTVEDVSDLTGQQAERHRVWDSCFDADFSYIHGGVVRESARSRYRQWMTHKLASWQDQFGSSGCVGCGRCVTWCPAAIDITAEAAALRGAPGSNLPDPAPPVPSGAAE
ncbi:MAG TPA: 4Fe-4S dicluster domain-containing protein [Ornithinibacter sp.]|nr:4Fe-4S dicluster domain-containing protein [Ornithinibacter sp.]